MVQKFLTRLAQNVNTDRVVHWTLGNVLDRAEQLLQIKFEGFHVEDVVNITHAARFFTSPGRIALTKFTDLMES